MSFAEEFLTGAIWPLCFLLVALFVLHSIRERLNPIVESVFSGLAKDAQRKYYLYAYGMLICAAASLQQLSKVSEARAWDIVYVACEVLQPTFVTLIAFLPRPIFAQPDGMQGKPTGNTAAPFSSGANDQAKTSP